MVSLFKRENLSVLGFFLLFSLFSLNAHADSGIHNADLMDGILSRFSSNAEHWENVIKGYASHLFWGLTLISMVWTYGFLALQRADIQAFFAETIKFFASTGFFLFLLENGPTIALSIIDSLRIIAAQASGVNKLVSPSSIVDVGFDIAGKVIDKSSIWSPASTTVGLMIASIILVVLAFVAVEMLILLISAWLLAYGGIFLLGFGGGRWTQDIAINYYRTILGLGMQSFAMVLIVGIGKSFIDQYYAAMGSDLALKELLIMLVVAIVLFYLIKKLPPMLASIVTGGGHGGGGGLGLGAVVGAAGMAGVATSMAADAGLSSAANVAGGASALKAAFQAAQQGLSGHERQGSKTSLSDAMGKAGSFVASMGSHLSQGVAETLGEKAAVKKEAIQSRIAETFGGKVATAIREDSSLDNEIQAGNNQSNDEILDFVNKGSRAKGGKA